MEGKSQISASIRADRIEFLRKIAVFRPHPKVGASDEASLFFNQTM